MTIDPNSISTPALHGILQSAIAPRPIAFASTIDKAGNVNLSPFSFFNVFGSNPPTLIFSPARRVQGNTTKHSLDNVLEVPEVVINIVNFPMVEQVSLASTEYERGINEFEKAGFTPVASERIAPPRVGEAPVAFECEVVQVIPTGTEGGAGNLVICKVVLVHIREEYLGENGKLDTRKLDLVARMGDSWYCRASGDALFEIPKPLLTRGIGVDALPESVRNSPVLTGNNLGRLGNLEQMPTPAEIAAIQSDPEVQTALQLPAGRMEALHQVAKKRVEMGHAAEGLQILMLHDGIPH